MILCWCCEVRLAEPDEETPLGSCPCAADYCVKCVLCERHCRCERAVGPDVVVQVQATNPE